MPHFLAIRLDAQKHHNGDQSAMLDSLVIKLVYGLSFAALRLSMLPRGALRTVN